MQKTMLTNRPIKPRYHGDIELIARDMNVHRDTVSAALSGVRRSKLAEAIREKAINSYNAIVL